MQPVKGIPVVVIGDRYGGVPCLDIALRQGGGIQPAAFAGVLGVQMGFDSVLFHHILPDAILSASASHFFARRNPGISPGSRGR